MRAYSVEYFKDERADWRWRVRASNGNIIATSGGDGYKNFGDAQSGFKSLCVRATFGLLKKEIVN